MRTHYFTILLVIIFILSGSCARNPVTGKRDFVLISKKQEIAMGQKADQQIVEFMGIYEDRELQNFIQEKGQEMVSISHRRELPYEFKIVDSPVVNAFAVPGGYVYFTRGILAHFNNEAEFAGVLGHEIGHIAARHTVKQQSKAMLAQVGLIAGMVISPEFAQFADLTQQGLGILFLKFGRDAERQSDRLGVEYSTKIGYDAEEMAEFFLTLQRLAEESGAAGVPSFLSTHPNPEDRFERVNELAQEWRQELNVTDLEVNRDEYLAMIEGMVYGEDPKQGFVENSIFYHPVLKFQFPIPDGWTFQNTPRQVQMAHADGNALMILKPEAGESLKAVAQSILQNYQLTPVESEETTVNGLPAFVMVADQQQQRGQAIRTLTYLISYRGNIYSIMGISSQENFNRFSPFFNKTMTNFSPLTDPEKLNRQPYRVRIKTVREPGTLAQALRNHQVPQDRLDEMAMLNGMELDDKVGLGMKLKVVEK